jgi:hypothetical protein
MLLLAHVLTALSSIAWTTYLLFRPSSVRLHVSQVLIAATLVSGTALTISQPAHILQACISGLVYSAGSCIAVIIANRKIKTAQLR